MTPSKQEMIMAWVQDHHAQINLFRDDDDRRWSALADEGKKQALSLLSELLAQILRHHSSNSNTENQYAGRNHR
jgi:hypothetical protein